MDKEGLCIKQLGTILCNPNRTPNEWCGILGSLFVNWNINIDQVKTVIKAFTNSNLDAALRTQGFILIPCLIYELQVCCLKSRLDIVIFVHFLIYFFLLEFMYKILF